MQNEKVISAANNAGGVMILAKLVRTITIPPVMAASMILIMRFARGYFPGDSAWWSIFFLSVLPVLAYPVWAVIPPLRHKGRGSQRALAVVFSVVGYALGTVYCLLTGSSAVELMVFITYMISGVLIALFSYAFGIKSSGHACGMSGPIAMLAYRVSPWFLLGYLLLVQVFWSSLKLKRHTASELALGTVFPVAAMALAILLM